MSKLYKVAFVVLAITLVMALIPGTVLAGKPVSKKAPPVNKGQEQKAAAPASKEDKGKVSNGSGDKKSPNASNGKNTSTPDQDGKGMDRGVDGNDKAHDGNNGCGNDKNDPSTPNEDDNNGKCLGLKKKAEPTPPPAEKPPVDEPPPTEIGPPVSMETPPVVIKQPPTRRVCWYSAGNAVETWDDLGDFLNESRIIGEALDVYCWDMEIGDTDYVLTWNSTRGHDGPQYLITIVESGDTIHIRNPFMGLLVLNGAYAVRTH